MHLGMPTLIENKTIEDNVGLCSRLGLNFIELNMNFPEYQIDRLEDADRFIRIAENKEIYYTIHLDENLDAADFNPLVAEAYLETVRRTINAAKKFLCLLKEDDLPLVINMHMNHGIHITLPDQKVQMYQRDYDTYIKSFEVFRTKCEEWIDDSDIRIAIENTDGFRDYEKNAIGLLLESPVFGLTWDIGHSKAAKEIDVPFILGHKEKLIHFHIHDGTEDPPRNHLALGDGDIDLENRLLTAKAQNARCVLETKSISALEKSVEYLREIGDYEAHMRQTLAPYGV